MQRCPFQQLGEATGGFDEIDCRIQTGFSFHVITDKPNAATIAKICQSDKCRAIMARMQAAAPQECEYSMMTKWLLYKDILTPILSQCAAMPPAPAPAPAPTPAPTPAPAPAPAATAPTAAPAPVPTTKQPVPSPPQPTPSQSAHSAATEDSDTPSPSTPNTSSSFPPTSAFWPSSPRASTAAPSSVDTSGTAQGTTTTTTTTTIVKSRSSNGITVGVIVGASVGVVVALILTLLLVKRNRRQPGGKYWRHSDANADADADAAGFAAAVHNGKTSARSAAAAETTITVSSSTTTRSDAKVHRPTPSAPTATAGTRAAAGAGELWEDSSIVRARVPLEDVALGDVLSRGAFGEVLLGRYRGETVAVKRLLPDRRRDMREIEGFLEEAKLMTALQHERVVRLVGVAWDSLTDLCVVVEYLAGGDLRSLLARFDAERRPTGFSPDKVKIAVHVAHALTYLHGMASPVVHRDLKSKNVLLDAQLNAKLTDFGVSRHKGDATMTAGVGSMLWMAPEVMMGARYDAKADVFSLGVVLSELDSQQLPYAHATERGTGRRLPDAAILQMVSLGTLSVAFSSAADAEIVALARGCVALEPTQRPTAAEVLHRLHRIWSDRFM